ncbi:two component regulator propeller [Prevotella sp. A2931]|uniref:Two component regulator propeller n=1 Tax=Prevotella illustrans TaxID=2800387 RepID=A0ABS3M882_9BACT|nr:MULTISPECIES: two component regulator propeller [Prevotella]MBO1364421.1 two component regulator propeller [Prevotella illustrans]PTL27318.1 two component regulator propeller [Prevotella sp. oral taxon 820]
MRNLIALSIMLLACRVLPLNAARFVPVLTNYTSLDYDGGLQNWSITQDKGGMMFFGNNAGMLSFDGYNWQMIPLPGNGVARSVLADGHRVYVGSYQEFGYFERDSFGQYQFTSLWKRLKGFKPHDDEIWNILKGRDEHIYFQSFCSWFEYDGQHVSAHYTPRQLPLYFFQIDGDIYVQLIDGPFCLLRNGRYVPLMARSELGYDDVVATIPLGQGVALLCTEYHGLYRFDGKHAIPFATAIDSRLRKEQVNRATITRDGHTIVVGTIMGGVYGIDRQGQPVWHYDRDNMLQNNTVLGLYTDVDDNVWAALDTGLALIHRGSPYTLLTGPMGMVYDVLNTAEGMYIATNQNTLLYKDGLFGSVAGTQGQNWHISRFGNQIIVGNNHGTRVVSSDQSHAMPGSGKASSTAIRRYNVSEDNDYLVEASYFKLRVYRNIDGRWVFNNNIQGFSAPVRQLEIDNHGVLWGSNMNKGCYRIELTADLRRVARLRYYPALGKDHASQIHVMKIRGEVVLSNGQQLFIADDKHGPQPFTSLSRLVGGSIISATTVDNSRFWLTTPKGYVLIAYENGQYRQKLNVPARFFGMECGDNLNNVRVFNNVAFFCLNGGVGRMDMAATMPARQARPALIISSAYFTDTGNKRHNMPINGDRPDAKGDMTIRLSYPNYNNAPLRFLFHLKGAGLDMETNSSRPEIHYSSLRYGSYELECSVRDANDNVLSTLRYAFRYPRPLFLSYPMLLVYLILLLTGVYLLIRWRANKLLRRHMLRAEAERIRQELALSEKQRIIDGQQKQQLEQLLQDKGREIATMAMDTVAGRESRHDDAYWKLFRENFDLIHKQFFRHLREQYPSLTPNDLKFCAYLRLNLSTKDIAQVTGMSVRGVEGARYRLRKKFNLAEGADLAAFLIDFK